MQSTPEQTAHVIEAASRATKVGGGTAVGGGFVGWAVENSEIISLVLAAGGFIVAVGGLAVTWYYSHKRLEIMREESQ